MRELDILAVDRAAHDDAIALIVLAVDHDAVAAVIVGDVLAIIAPLLSLFLALLRGLLTTDFSALCNQDVPGFLSILNRFSGFSRKSLIPRC